MIKYLIVAYDEEKDGSVAKVTKVFEEDTTPDMVDCMARDLSGVYDWVRVHSIEDGDYTDYIWGTIAD